MINPFIGVHAEADMWADLSLNWVAPCGHTYNICTYTTTQQKLRTRRRWYTDDICDKALTAKILNYIWFSLPTSVAYSTRYVPVVRTPIPIWSMLTLFSSFCTLYRVHHKHTIDIHLVVAAQIQKYPRRIRMNAPGLLVNFYVTDETAEPTYTSERTRQCGAYVQPLFSHPPKKRWVSEVGDWRANYCYARLRVLFGLKMCVFWGCATFLWWDALCIWVVYVGLGTYMRQWECINGADLCTLTRLTLSKAQPSSSTATAKQCMENSVAACRMENKKFRTLSLYRHPSAAVFVSALFFQLAL